jgi:hypothetical protein
VTAVQDEVTDDFADVNVGENVGGQSGPLTGSRGTRARSGGGTGTRRTSRLEKRIGALQEKLSQEMFMGGSLIGMAIPVTGYYICQESHNFTSAVCQLAQSRPEWVDALEKLADIGPGITIGRTVIGMGAALAVDRGRADPEKAAMKFLGVYNAWLAVNGEQERTVPDGSGYRPPPAPAFSPV